MVEARKRKNIDDLTFGDEYLFEAVMQNKELCKSFIETFLEISDVTDIEYISSEESYKDSYWAKGVRFDIYVKGQDGVAYVVELQQTDTKEIDKRLRYYQSMIDSKQLPKGRKRSYKDLLDSYIIFIAREDLYGRGRYRYTFLGTCLEEPDLILKNGAHTLVFNTRGTHGDVSEDVKAFLRAIEGESNKDIGKNNNFVQKFEKYAEEVKASETWRKSYMQTELRLQDKFDAGVEIGMEKGIEKGIEKGKLEIAKNLLMTDTSHEVIAQVTNLPLETIKKLVE